MCKQINWAFLSKIKYITAKFIAPPTLKLMPNFTNFTKRAFLTTTLTDLKYNLTDSNGDLCTKLLFIFNQIKYEK